MEKILRFYEYKARDIIRGKTFTERERGRRKTELRAISAE